MRALAVRYFDQLQLFSANIKRLRLQNKYTQMELAELVGLEPQYIQTLEYGRTNPSLAVALAIADAFKVDLNELFCEIPLEKQKRGRPRKIDLITD